MPNALFKRFNGTTFEEFKFEAFDSEKLGGVSPSNAGKALLQLSDATGAGDYFLRYSFDGTNHSALALNAADFRSSIGAGDVVGPASSVNNRIATFDGTTGKLIKDSGTLVSGLATSSHTHGEIDSAGSITGITTTVGNGDNILIRDADDLNRIVRGPAFGTSSTTFLANDGFFRTAGAITHSARLASTLNTAGNTTSVSVFSLTNITPGQYMIMIEGRWARNTSLNARAWQGTLFVNNAANVLLDAVVEHVSIASFTGQTMAHLNAASASAYDTGNNWSTTSSATAASGSPFFVLGRLSIAGAANKTLNFQFRQSISDGSNTCSILAGTSIQLIKVG